MAKSKIIRIDIDEKRVISTGIILGTKGNKPKYLKGEIGSMSEKELLILHKATDGAYTTFIGKGSLDDAIGAIDNYPEKDFPASK